MAITRYTAEEAKKLVGDVQLPAYARNLDAPKKSGLQKLAGILDTVFGGGKIGEAIGTQIAKHTAKDAFGNSAAEFVEKGPSAGEILGDVGQIGLTLGTLGLPSGMAAKVGLKAIKPIGTTLKGAATVGGGFGLTGALKGGETDVKELAKSTALGVGVGAGIHGAGKLLSTAAKQITVDTPKKLVNLGLGVPAKKAPQGINEAFLKRPELQGKSVAKITEITGKEIESVGKQIQKKLTSKAGGITTKDFLTKLADDVNTRTGSTLTYKELQSRLKGFVPDHAKLLSKKQITWAQLNQLRTAVDKNLKETTFLGKELTGEQQVIKNFANRIRRTVQNNTGTKALFKRQSEAIRINDLAQKAMNKLQTTGKVGLLDLSGAGVGGLVGGIPGAAVGIGLERGLRSPTTQLVAGSALRKLGNVTQGKGAAVSPAVRAALLRLFGLSQEGR